MTYSPSVRWCAIQNMSSGHKVVLERRIPACVEHILEIWPTQLFNEQCSQLHITWMWNSSRRCVRDVKHTVAHRTCICGASGLGNQTKVGAHSCPPTMLVDAHSWHLVYQQVLCRKHSCPIQKMYKVETWYTRLDQTHTVAQRLLSVEHFRALELRGTDARARFQSCSHHWRFYNTWLQTQRQTLRKTQTLKKHKHKETKQPARAHQMSWCESNHEATYGKWLMYNCSAELNTTTNY